MTPRSFFASRPLIIATTALSWMVLTSRPTEAAEEYKKIVHPVRNPKLNRAIDHARATYETFVGKQKFLMAPTVPRFLRFGDVMNLPDKNKIVEAGLFVYPGRHDQSGFPRLIAGAIAETEPYIADGLSTSRVENIETSAPKALPGTKMYLLLHNKTLADQADWQNLGQPNDGLEIGVLTDGDLYLERIIPSHRHEIEAGSEEALKLWRLVRRIRNGSFAEGITDSVLGGFNLVAKAAAAHAFPEGIPDNLLDYIDIPTFFVGSADRSLTDRARPGENVTLYLPKGARVDPAHFLVGDIAAQGKQTTAITIAPAHGPLVATTAHANDPALAERAKSVDREAHTIRLERHPEGMATETLRIALADGTHQDLAVAWEENLSPTLTMEIPAIPHKLEWGETTEAETPKGMLDNMHATVDDAWELVKKHAPKGADHLFSWTGDRSNLAAKNIRLRITELAAPEISALTNALGPYERSALYGDNFTFGKANREDNPENGYKKGDIEIESYFFVKDMWFEEDGLERSQADHQARTIATFANAVFGSIQQILETQYEEGQVMDKEGHITAKVRAEQATNEFLERLILSEDFDAMDEDSQTALVDALKRERGYLESSKAALEHIKR